MAAQPDYYEILQVHPSAEPEVVQAAYRRLSLKYHPDVYSGPDAHQRMALLNQAYQVLSDPSQRSAYDRQRAGARSRSVGPATPVLQVTPLEVHVGALPKGRSRTATIHITNGGPGKLSGLVVSHVPWLQVSPSQFEGNDLDIVLRIQGDRPGEFGALTAVEVYSNGGRVPIHVRGVVQEQNRSQPPDAPPRASMARGPVARRPTTDIARPLGPFARLPFMAWVAIGTAVSSVVWFNIAPGLALIPLGLGAWLVWERLMRDHAADVHQQGHEASRQGPTLARCRVCHAASNLATARKCPRCGGAICFACGACACTSGRGRGRTPL
ncbi:MAG: J domain-containing protein [Chloroflexi bacterium]|nr:J domain-containing protein [Chloroflexota bacterium]